MPYVTIEPYDGEFHVRPMSDETADRLRQQGDDPIYIEDDVYDAWVTHQKQHRVFHALWIQLRNQYVSKRR